MEKLIVKGGKRLRGEVTASGAKNSALPILAATLACEGESVIRNVPDLTDIRTMCSLLEELGAKVAVSGNSVRVTVVDPQPITASYETVRKMRASVSVLGPLLARRGAARVSLPGGCAIGVRPIDLHIKGLKALGADVGIEHGYIEARATRMKGANIFLAGPFGSTVLGTANVMTAAALSAGRTVIEGAACEPEIADLADFLGRAGAKIFGAGSPRITVVGVERLAGCEHYLIPDRIEVGSFIAAAAITGGEVKIRNTRTDHISAIIDAFEQLGVELTVDGTSLIVKAPEVLRPTDITTLPYPGYPTDMQAQAMAVLTVADGISVINEKVYPDRFLHVAELNRLGANLRKEGSMVVVKGVEKLSGAPLMASDLRASIALVIAGLRAEGETEVKRVYHIDRGYEKLLDKFASLGAELHRAEDDV